MAKGRKRESAAFAEATGAFTSERRSNQEIEMRLPAERSACWRRTWLIHDPTKNQRCIGSTEPERIGQNYVDGAPFGVMRYEINCGLDGGIAESDGRRRDTGAHGKDREDCLDSARRAQQMPDR